MKSKMFLIGALALSSLSTIAQDIDGPTKVMVVADGKLVIGGRFEKSDRRVVNNVTTWDGTKFAGLAKGVDGQCLAIASSGKNVYVAGDYSVVNKASDGSSEIPSNRIAHWDGAKWNSLGSQTVDRDVYAAVCKENKLYIGGNFTKIGGNLETKGVGVWDGKKWSALGNAQFDRAVLAMAFVGNDLYVAGIFKINGDEPMEGIAKWDGKVWTEPFRGGLNDIKTLVSDGKNLYMGGSFGLKMFDGTTVTEIKGAPTEDVFGICVDGSKVYIAGGFTMVGGKKCGGVAMLEGGKWTNYPEIPYATFACVAVYNGVVYAGGQFDGSGDAKNIVKLENGNWVKAQK